MSEEPKIDEETQGKQDNTVLQNFVNEFVTMREMVNAEIKKYPEEQLVTLFAIYRKDHRSPSQPSHKNAGKSRGTSSESGSRGYGKPTQKMLNFAKVLIKKNNLDVDIEAIKDDFTAVKNLLDEYAPAVKKKEQEE